MVQTDEERKAKKKAENKSRIEKKYFDKTVEVTMTFADTISVEDFNEIEDIKNDAEEKRLVARHQYLKTLNRNDNLETLRKNGKITAGEAMDVWLGKYDKEEITLEEFGKIENMTDKEAEDLVGKLFELKGYDVKIGVMSKDGKNKRIQDGGIDVRAEKENKKIGIQVKHWKQNVKFDDVAKTLGVAKGFTKMIVISTKSGFTPQSLEHAKENRKIELWDCEKFKKELEEYGYSYEK